MVTRYGKQYEEEKEKKRIFSNFSTKIKNLGDPWDWSFYLGDYLWACGYTRVYPLDTFQDCFLVKGLSLRNYLKKIWKGYHSIINYVAMGLEGYDGVKEAWGRKAEKGWVRCRKHDTIINMVNGPMSILCHIYSTQECWEKPIYRFWL